MTNKQHRILNSFGGLLILALVLMWINKVDTDLEKVHKCETILWEHLTKTKDPIHGDLFIIKDEE